MIIIKNKDDIEKMRGASRLAREALEIAKKITRPGISTLEIDQQVEQAILKQPGAWPSFKGYRGYKFCTCLSVNEEVVHGIPTANRILQEGDLLSIDVGVKLDGFHGDVAETVPVGKISREKARLIETTRDALKLAVKLFRPGVPLGRVSSAIEELAHRKGYTVVREYYGHGIGRSLHEDPLVPNYGQPEDGPVLKDGMVFALEPMLNIGGSKVRTLEDGWTVVTMDGQPSAHFEHTVALVAGKTEVLTG